MRYFVSARRITAVRSLAFHAILVCLIPAASLQAQILRGTVKNGDTGVPIADASVVLLDDDGKIQRGTLTEPDGTFVLQAPDDGSYTLRVGAAGFVVQNTPPLHVSDGGDAQVDILLQSEDRASGPPTGFTQRMSRGEGVFITREQIVERNYNHFTDIFQYTPAIKVVPLPVSARMSSTTSTPAVMPGFSRRAEDLLGVTGQYRTVRIKEGRDFNRVNVGATQQGELANDCVPVLWVNGIWWGNIDQSSLNGPDGAFAPADIDAIEIYNHPSILPDQFNSGRDTQCGVVVVWTRRSKQ